MYLNRWLCDISPPLLGIRPDTCVRPWFWACYFNVSGTDVSQHDPNSTYEIRFWVQLRSFLTSSAALMPSANVAFVDLRRFRARVPNSSSSRFLEFSSPELKPWPSIHFGSEEWMGWGELTFGLVAPDFCLVAVDPCRCWAEFWASQRAQCWGSHGLSVRNRHSCSKRCCMMLMKELLRYSHSSRIVMLRWGSG